MKGNTDILISNTTTKSADYFNSQLFGDFSTREFLDENLLDKSRILKWDISKSTLSKLRNVLPCARFIIMIRDPVERLYSDYIYFSGRQYYYTKAGHTDMSKITPRDFHEKCVAGIQWWKLCMLQHKNDANVCLHSTTATTTKGIPNLNTSHNKCWSNSNYTCKAFRNGFYYYYIKDWLEVFPKSHFKFVRLEDYSRNMYSTLNEVLKFLGVRWFDNNEMQVLQRMVKMVPGGATLRDQYPPMMDQTRQMLTEFYRETNVKLTKLLGDDQLLTLWQA